MVNHLGMISMHAWSTANQQPESNQQMIRAIISIYPSCPSYSPIPEHPQPPNKNTCGPLTCSSPHSNTLQSACDSSSTKSAAPGERSRRASANPALSASRAGLLDPTRMRRALADTYSALLPSVTGPCGRDRGGGGEREGGGGGERRMRGRQGD